MSLSFVPGTLVANTGPSGVGKSTFASLILRFHDPEQGRVLVDGRNTRDFERASLRKQIALVPQENLLFKASLRENIALGVPDEVSDEPVEEAARLTDAYDFIMAMPEGYDTMVAERGTTLSAGQRQRIGIVRASLRDCPILLLDEPTVALDRTSEAAVIEAIERITADRTSFLIAHDLTLASRCERVLCFSGSAPRPEAVTHEASLSEGGQYASLRASARNSGRQREEYTGHTLGKRHVVAS